MSIRYKMMIPILIILISLGSVLVYVFQHKTLGLVSNHLKIKGETTIRSLISSSREGVFNDNIFGSLDRLVSNSLQDKDILSLIIMDRKMSVLASNIESPVLDNRLNFSKFDISIFESPSEIVLNAPIKTENDFDETDHVIGHIQLVLSKDVIRGEIDLIINTMTLIIFTAIFLTAVFMFITTHFLLRPILSLTISSKKIEQGNYDEEIQVSGHDEIGLLSNAFETMRQNVNKKMIEITLAKEEAIQLAKFRETFLANMSHEIRTPMNGVIGIIELLTVNTTLDDTQQEYVEIIKNSSNDLLAILNDILDLSKLEAGEMNVSPKTFNYQSLIHKVKSLFIGKAKESELDLISEYSEGFPDFILADDNRITQIISNFVSNAIKFTDSGYVKISSSFTKIDNIKILVKIEVIDTGVGIDEAGQKLAFEEFKQLDEGSTKAFKGTGLGLAICSKLTKMMGGEIGVESKPGIGSTFWFTFEAEIVKATQKELNKLKQSKEILEHFALNVLLVDDEKVNIMVAKLMLEGLGCTVTTAENGQIAVDLFEEGKFDVVLMDMQMPVMDGIAATQMIRKSYSKIPPIIGLSANAMVGDAEKFIAQGLDDYMSKPVTIFTMKEKLNQYCR